jgi:hypothetical protein
MVLTIVKLLMGDVCLRDEAQNQGFAPKNTARFGGVTLGGLNSWRVTPSHTQICL